MRAPTVGGIQTIALIVTGIVGAVLTYKAIKSTSAAAEGVRNAVGSVVNAIDPSNPNNVISRTVNKTVQTVTGDPNATLGTKLAEIFDPATRAADRTAADLNRPAGYSAQVRALDQLAFDRDDMEAGMFAAAQSSGIPFMTALDIDDLSLPGAIERARAEAPYFGNMGQIVRGR